ncbi:hypothetical protein GBAR_LOCUS24169 [Geodia barretti]|uniref:Uncharacterized protein n=1 Tax=Geodia barretti TaxID=519541 RepID=A0AA35T8T7_GEOBA|nr:hypothetical protein GBAR_LOCUS24169 [Geodia barretti]
MPLRLNNVYLTSRFASFETCRTPLDRARIKLRASGETLKKCQSEVSAYSTCVSSKPHLTQRNTVQDQKNIIIIILYVTDRRTH